MEGAADEMDRLGYSGSLDFIQVPHHGSKRNVGPSILDRLVGPKCNSDEHLSTAFVSAATNGEPKHPAKQVTNAFRRRGSYVFATQGQQICHSHGAPSRIGWSPLAPIAFYYEVEE